MIAPNLHLLFTKIRYKKIFSETGPFGEPNLVIHIEIPQHGRLLYLSKIKVAHKLNHSRGFRFGIFEDRQEVCCLEELN